MGDKMLEINRKKRNSWYGNVLTITNYHKLYKDVKVTVEESFVPVAKTMTWRVQRGRGMEYIVTGNTVTGQQKFMHHYVWGEKPDNGQIRFTDGDRFNCTKENLYLLQKKAVKK